MNSFPDAERPLDVMCADMLQYHASLRESLPRIRASLDAIAGTDAPPEMELMRAAFAALAEMLEAHLSKEENLLFPALAALSDAERTGRGRPPLPFATLLYPIRMMESEHLRIESALDVLRNFAADSAKPASPAWHACQAALRRLDEELRLHDQFENEVLFPAALDLERRLL